MERRRWKEKYKNILNDILVYPDHIELDEGSCYAKLSYNFGISIIILPETIFFIDLNNNKRT